MAWIERKWTSWSPTVTQLGSVTVTVTNAVYKIDGEMCVVNAQLTVTGSGTANNAITIGGQPADIQASANQLVIGVMNILDSSTSTQYVGIIRVSGATDWRGIAHGLTSVFGVAPNFGLASGDVIMLQAAYRVA